MEAIVLAGGLGSRLRDVVKDVPKPMALINGTPFLEIVLKELSANGFKRLVIAVSYKANLIKDYFGSSAFGMDIFYSTEVTPLGTGGAINSAISKINGNFFFVFNGDTYLELEFDKLVSVFRESNGSYIVCRTVNDIERYGSILCEGDKIIGFGEKNHNGFGLINAGTYILEKKLFQDFHRDQPFSLEIDFLPSAVKKYNFSAFISNGKFIDIGVPEDYFMAQSILKNK